ncbi:MAG: hypothetical protein ACO3A2_05880 [Bdellovibrionia bacterium]
MPSLTKPEAEAWDRVRLGIKPETTAEESPQGVSMAPHSFIRPQS